MSISLVSQNAVQKVSIILTYSFSPRLFFQKIVKKFYSFMIQYPTFRRSDKSRIEKTHCFWRDPHITQIVYFLFLYVVAQSWYIYNCMRIMLPKWIHFSFPLAMISSDHIVFVFHGSKQTPLNISRFELVGHPISWLIHNSYAFEVENASWVTLNDYTNSSWHIFASLIGSV